MRFVTAIAVITVLALTGAAAHPVTRYRGQQPLPLQIPADRPLQVSFLGDSLTGSLFASTRDNGFPELMLKTLGNAVISQHSPTGGRAIDAVTVFVAPQNVDLAVVELGTNDLGNNVPLDVFADAYRTLINRTMTASPKADLVCAGVWQASLSHEGLLASSRYNGVIREACTSAGGDFVSLNPIYARTDTIGPAGLPAEGGTSDNFHPNDRGHRMIADALLGLLDIRR